ncbi:MAG: Kelch repeat-containing protein [Candidatus Kapaibacterium sp.]
MARLFIFVLSLSSLFALDSDLLRGQVWEGTELMPIPEPVTNNAVVEGRVGDTLFLYSFGGLDSTKLFSGIHRRCWRYNTVSNRWEALPTLPDTLGKIASAASRVGDTIYIIGGYYVFANGSEVSSDRVHRFDLKRNTFVADGAPIPKPIDDQVQVVWHDSLIYVITGWSNSGNVPDVQIYDPRNDVWSSGNSVPNTTRYAAFGASGAIVEDTIFYYGGAAGGFNFPIRNIIRKGVINRENPTLITWSEVDAPDLPPGYRTATGTSRGKVYWIGGSNLTYNYDGIAYNGSGGVEPSEQIVEFNPANSSWSVETLPRLPMDLRGLAKVDEQTFVLIGGMAAGQRVSSQVLRLSLDDKSGVESVEWSEGDHVEITELNGAIHLRFNAVLTDPVQVSFTNLLGISFEPLLQNDRITTGDKFLISTQELQTGCYVLSVRVGRESWSRMIRVVR